VLKRRLSTKAFDKAGRAPALPPLVRSGSFTQGEIERRERLQKLRMMDQGITFRVRREEGTERIFPFDFVRV